MQGGKSLHLSSIVAGMLLACGGPAGAGMGRGMGSGMGRKSFGFFKKSAKAQN